MGDDVLGLASGRLDAGLALQGVGIGGGLGHAAPGIVGGDAVERIDGIEPEIDGGDGGDAIPAPVVEHVGGGAFDVDVRGGRIGIGGPVCFRLEHVLGGGTDRTTENELGHHEERIRRDRSGWKSGSKICLWRAKDGVWGASGASPTASAGASGSGEGCGGAVTGERLAGSPVRG